MSPSVVTGVNEETPSENRILISAFEHFNDLIPPFLERRHRECEEIPAALDARDFRGIARMGHRMCGSGEPLGFPEITEIGRVLERAGENQDREEILVQVERLRDYLSRIVVVYDRED